MHARAHIHTNTHTHTHTRAHAQAHTHIHTNARSTHARTVHPRTQRLTPSHPCPPHLCRWFHSADMDHDGRVTGKVRSMPTSSMSLGQVTSGNVPDIHLPVRKGLNMLRLACELHLILLLRGFNECMPLSGGALCRMRWPFLRRVGFQERSLHRCAASVI